MKTKMPFKIIILSFILILGWGVYPSQAEFLKDLSIGGYFKNETYLRLNSPGDIMSSRNVLNVEFSHPDLIPRLPMKVFIQLRPMYDAVFDIESEGMGSHENNSLKRHWQHNINRQDDWDPLLRECWVSFNFEHFEARLGKQIVTWGKSDGIYLLDLIHPFNNRNICVFEAEDTKIPLWMVNLNYWFDAENGLQLLWIPRYVPSHSGWDGHSWALEITKLVDDYYGDLGSFYGFPGAYPPIRVDVDEPGTSLSNSEIGVRWTGMIGRLCYTLNYFYTWDDYLNDYFDPVSWSVNRRPDRLSIFGGTFEYCFAKALGVENWVLRGEIAYFKNDVSVEYDFSNHEKNHIDVMLGFDKYFFIDYWVSIQVAPSFILNPDKWRKSYYDIGGRLKYIDFSDPSNPYPVFEGLRDAVTCNYTFYVMKDFLPADILHTELFFLYDGDGTFWLRPKVKYDVLDPLHVTLGFNFFWGRNEMPLGQFDHHDNMFVEVKYDF